MPAPQQSIPPIGILGIQGRNGSDSPFVVPSNQCLEAYNVDWYRSSLGAKRGGASALAITGGTAFSSGVRSMGRFVPADDQTAAELFALDGAFVLKRLAGGTAFANVTLDDPITASAQEVNYVALNGKLYISYKSAHNRMHVYDPAVAKVRRTSLDLPAVATLGVNVGGAVTDTRKYRIAWTKQVSGVTTYRSNLSVATASRVLAAEQVPVTRGTVPGEGETHWELYTASTSSSFGDYRLILTTVIATATVNDNQASLSGLTVAPDDGANTPLPSAKYMVADDGRLIMAGAYEAVGNTENAMVPKNNRVWWTSAPGAGTGDDERVSNTGTINSYADLEEAITGLSQPMQLVSSAASSLERGSFYVFSFDSQWKFISTGTASAPYIKFRVTGGGGCIHHKSIVTAEDVNGNPSIYWASKRGMMRITTAGQEFIGEDIIDIWETINLDATIPCHSVFHADKHQVWFFIATGTSSYPNIRVVYDTRLGRVTESSGVRFGWALHEGEQTKAYCSCLFSNTISTSMGRALKPYIGYTGSTAVWKCDTTDTDDAGTAFQAYVDTKSYAPWGLGRKGGLSDEVIIVADPSPGVTVKLTIYRDEGIESLPSYASLTDTSDSAAAEQLFKKFDSSKLSDSFSFRCRVGDEQAISNTWNIDALIVPVSYQGDN